MNKPSTTHGGGGTDTGDKHNSLEKSAQNERYSKISSKKVHFVPRKLAVSPSPESA